MRRVILPLHLLLALAMACSGDDSSGDGDPGDGEDAAGDDGSGDDASSDDTGSGSASDDDGASDDGASGDDDGSDSGGASDGSQGSPGVPPSFVPQFPGAGTAADTEPLQGGMLCDAVAGDAPELQVPTTTRCFFGPEDQLNAAASIEQALECAEGTDVLHLRLTFDPGFNDNTFGEGSIGWSPRRGHRFRDLVGSDHAELKLVDGDGEVAMQFKIDYITEDSSADSGYASLGVEGGDGEVSIGDAAHVVDFSTSLDRNLNERGYGDYTVDSPATDEAYTPNPDTPEWDYRMVFEVWIDLEAFGDAGFSGAFIDYVHASPAKTPSDTIEVVPGECVPPCEADACPTDHPCYDGDPDTVCDYGDPCTDYDEGTACEPGDDGCWDGDPDTFCNQGDIPPPGDDDPPSDDSDPPPGESDTPAYCELYPTDPSCYVE